MKTNSSWVTTVVESFSPLRSRNFSIYLGGQAVSLIGTWLQLTAQSWVVWELTGSEHELGVVGMLGTLPILLLGPWAGVIADRMDRRKVLIWTQVAAMILALILATLTGLRIIQIWHLYVLSTLLGVVTALDMPTQQAFIGDLAGMAEVRKAVVLNATIIQISRILGPALAGTLIAAMGASTVFGLNGVSFLAVIASLLMISSTQIRKSGRGAALSEFGEGLSFISSQPRLLDLILFVMLMTFFGMPVMTILPSVADEMLHGDAATLGLLMSASGVGALVSTLLVVPLSQAQHRLGVVVTGMVLWLGAWVLVLAQSTQLEISMLALFCTGLAAPVVFTTASGLLQQLGPPDMRARLLSTYTMLTFGMQPFAALFIGYSAEQLGTSLGILINGILLIAGAILIFLLRSELRTWELTPQGPRPVPPVVPPAQDEAASVLELEG